MLLSFTYFFLLSKKRFVVWVIKLIYTFKFSDNGKVLIIKVQKYKNVYSKRLT